MLRRFILLAVLAVGILLQTSTAPLRALELEPAGITTVILPAGSMAIKPVSEADLNQDGSPERLQLAGGRLAILSAGQPVWQSPSTWTVVQAGITDLNQDGKPEATLLVWRPFRPWPVDQWLPYAGRIADFHDAKGNSCQIILIGWRGKAYGELWAGSPMAEPVHSFAVADLRGDGRELLVTLEGSYLDSRSAASRALKIWEWNGFGFTIVSTLQGTFYEMALVQARNGRNLILVP